MRYQLIIIAALFSVLYSNKGFAQEASLLSQIDSLASSLNLEFVTDKMLPEVNPYGSYGSTYVYGLLYYSNHDRIDESILFLCRKKDEGYSPNDVESSLDLIRKYEYSLVFAVKFKDEAAFKIHSIIDDRIGLMGMSLYYGDLDLKPSEFRYVNSPQEKVSGNERISLYNGSIPVVISSISSTKILYLYNDEWVEYVEIVD